MVARFHACDRTRLQQALTADLPADRQREFDEHLQSCDDCRDEFERLAGKLQCWGDIRQALNSSGEAQPWEVSHESDRREADSRCESKPDANQIPATNSTNSTTEDDSISDEAWQAVLLELSDDPIRQGRLGGYELERVIGRGGMGVVLKAYDEGLNRHVAIKVLAAQLSTSATARRRFAREAQAAAAVVHDHVVPIFAIDAAGRLPYLVMAYINGRSLQERIDQTGPLETWEIVRIAFQAASGLAAAHAQGLVHRDIKPANILLENGVERVRLTDFGLARAVDDASQTQSGFIAGTPQYMAPEQARGEAVDFRADLFSLGSVMYAMCVGQPPFRAESTLAVLRRICEDQPRDVRAKNADIPDWLSAIVRRLHAKDPADRFQSAAEVAELLGQYLAWLQQPTTCPMPTSTESLKGSRPMAGGAQVSGGATQEQTVSQASGKGRRRMVAWALFAIAAIAGGAVMKWGLTPYKDQTPSRSPGPATKQTTMGEFADESRWDWDMGSPLESGSFAPRDVTDTLSAELEATRRAVGRLEQDSPSRDGSADGIQEIRKIDQELDRLERELAEPDA